MFSKVLVANRGEIAVRVIRALDELGIASVAVYSEADRDAQHVQRAGEAYLLGPGPAAESYLKVDKIIEVCKESGAEAVHPGYGFLAENASFAKALEENGITFIGPPASAIEAMGSKTRARELMKKAGVPIVPGTTEPVETIEDAKQIAEDIGYPIAVKAAGGGGAGAEQVGLGRPSDVLRVAVGLRVDGHGGDPELVERADHAHGDLSTVGDEDLAEHRRRAMLSAALSFRTCCLL